MKTSRSERSEYAANVMIAEGAIKNEGAKLAWKIEENVRVHGFEWAARWAKKQGYSFDVVFYALFGKFPRK